MYEAGALKRRIAAGEPLLGTFCFLPSPDSAEAATTAGLDFVIIDMEHAAKDWSVLTEMIRATQIGGGAALVRVPANDSSVILRVLEAGADGIVIPFVRTANDVARASDATLYPPQGSRGTCGLTRHGRFGLALNDFEALSRAANENTVLIGQVEDPVGVENIEEILDQEPGLDVVLVGRGDLSSAMGLVGRSNGPEITAIVERMLRLRRPGRPAFGLFVISQREIEQWSLHGASLFALSSDTAVLAYAHAKAKRRFDNELAGASPTSKTAAAIAAVNEQKG